MKARVPGVRPEGVRSARRQSGLGTTYAPDEWWAQDSIARLSPACDATSGTDEGRACDRRRVLRRGRAVGDARGAPGPGDSRVVPGGPRQLAGAQDDLAGRPAQRD